MTQYQSDEIALLSTVIDPRFKTKFVTQNLSVASCISGSDNNSETPQAAETSPGVVDQLIFDCIKAKLVKKIITCNDQKTSAALESASEESSAEDEAFQGEFGF